MLFPIFFHKQLSVYIFLPCVSQLPRTVLVTNTKTIHLVFFVVVVCYVLNENSYKIDLICEPHIHTRYNCIEIKNKNKIKKSSHIYTVLNGMEVYMQKSNEESNVVQQEKTHSCGLY